MYGARGRRTKGDIMSGFSHSEDIVKSRFVAANTVEITLADGTRIIRLHDTNIVELSPDGYIMLLSGGWKTPLTRDRINVFLPAGVYLFQRNWEWYVKINGETHDFVEGMSIKNGEIFLNRAVSAGVIA